MTRADANERPDIDGLRALAALSVLLFHFKTPFFDGGYVGVDVFLVISGYLIYGTSLASLTGFAQLPNFFRRRVARILPALVVTVVMTLLAVRLFVPARMVGDAYASAIAALAFFANHYFYSTTDYFAAPATSPFLHLWSISLEEQFYFFFPLLLLALRQRVAGLILIAAVSAAASMVIENTGAVFYLLPFRAWEFLLGACLIRARPLTKESNSGVAGLLFSLGFALIAIGVLWAPDLTAWNFDHLIPAAGAALVLYAGHRRNSGSRILGVAPFRVIGKSSYSIYLFHWPMWALFLLILNRKPQPFETVAMIVLTLALAQLNFTFVERPLLKKLRAISPKASLVLATITLAACAGLAFCLEVERTHVLLPQIENSPLGMALKKATAPHAYDSAYRRGLCMLDETQALSEFSVESCATAKPGQKTILLWGDSYAAHYFPGLAALEEKSWHVTQATAASCPPFMPKISRHCSEFHHYVATELLPKLKPDFLILAADWNRIGSAQEIESGLLQVLKNQPDLKVLLVGQGPTFLAAVPLRIPEKWFKETTPAAEILVDEAERVHIVNVAQIASNLGVKFFDLHDELCSNGKCKAVIDGELMIWDRGGHLTVEGSKRMAPLLLKSLSETNLF